ncbi:MAG: ABC transporter permease [Pirellula sp.]|nr:ABC transporter permease [Pirellula sp.]
MPLLDIGYRKWEGEKTPRSTRSLALASTGIHLVWKGTWLKRILMFMAIPALIAGIFVATFEQTLDRDGPRALLSILAKSPQSRNIAQRAGVDLNAAIESPESYRHFTWSYILFNLSRYPQALGMIVVLGLVAPRLISYDLRSRGYLLYLSRPLTPAEYIFGKSLVLFFLLFVMSALPALLIYVAGLFLSTDSTAIAQTWDIPLRILLASLVLMVPTTAVALAFSAMTQESRYAGFAWFSMWVVGSVTYFSLWTATQLREQFQNQGRGARIEAMAPWNSFKLFSPYETLGYLQQQIFGLAVKDPWTWAPWIAVAFVSVAGYGFAYWKVSRVLKA